MKEHPENGRRLLAELGFGKEVQRLVLDHHERIDGSGYPRGIADGALDLVTRILAACDVYDALVSPRIYREAWTHLEAMRYLRGAARAQFRPALRRGAGTRARARALRAARRRRLATHG